MPAPTVPPVYFPPAQPVGGYPAGAYPRQGYPQPGFPPPAPKKGLGVGAILGIVGGGVVLLVIIVAVIVFALRPGNGAPGDGGTGAGDATNTPSGVVVGYLEALAAGDAEAALSFTARDASTWVLAAES